MELFSTPLSLQVLNAAAASFLPDDEKMELTVDLQRRMEAFVKEFAP